MCPELSGIYDSNPIQPVCKIGENLGIWSQGQWGYYKAKFIEPIPRSSPMIVEAITASGATTLAANGTIAKRIAAILLLNDRELLHLRWEPLDDVEGLLWEQSGSGRFVTRSVQARVTRFTALRDPYLATTTFFILGMNRDMNLEVRNPNPVVIAIARFVFFGYRYLLDPLTAAPAIYTSIPAEGM
jgi:hypothetical protein